MKKAFLNAVKAKMEIAWNEAQQTNNENSYAGEEKLAYSIKHSKKYGDYWEIETGKDIFKGIKSRSGLKKAAFEYLKNGNKNYKIVDDLNDNNVVRFIRESREEYLYGTNSKELSNQEYKQKMRLAPSIDDLIENAPIKYRSPLIHNNTLFPNGYDNFQGILKIDDNYFRYLVRIGLNKNDQSVFYDVSLENLDKQKGTDTTVPGVKNSSLIKNKSVPLSTNNVPQRTPNVNNDTSSTNNTQNN